jgi:hypothetical protein
MGNKKVTILEQHEIEILAQELGMKAIFELGVWTFTLPRFKTVPCVSFYLHKIYLNLPEAEFCEQVLVPVKEQLLKWARSEKAKHHEAVVADLPGISRKNRRIGGKIGP